MFDGFRGLMARRTAANVGEEVPLEQGGLLHDIGLGVAGAYQGLVNPNAQNNLISRGLQATGNYLSQVPQDAAYLAETYGPKIRRGLAAAAPVGSAQAATYGVRG